MEHVLGEFGLDEPVQGQGHLLAGLQGLVHQHGVAHVDEQHGLGVGGELVLMDLEVAGLDPHRNPAPPLFQRLHEGLADVDVEGVAVLVAPGLLQPHALVAGPGAGVLAPAVLVHELEDLLQGLVAELAHAPGADPHAAPGAHQVARVHHHLLDPLEVLELLVGFLPEQFAHGLQVEVGDVAEPSPPPTQELLQVP